jgi:CO dehydrogenase maturation factor
MKIAIAGKGGVGKTTLSGLLARHFAAQGFRVLAIDADPDANLASCLPLDDGERIVPLAARTDLIDRLSGRDGTLSPGLILLNPDVGEILPEIRLSWGGGHGLLVLGWHKGGGAGCYCAENAVLKRVLGSVATGTTDVVLLDSEAGLEHLSRGTPDAAQVILAVVEPGQRSLETAFAIRDLACDLGIHRVFPVLCGARDAADEERVRQGLGDWPLLATLPFSEEIRAADLDGRPPVIEPAVATVLHQLAHSLIYLCPLPETRQ